MEFVLRKIYKPKTKHIHPPIKITTTNFNVIHAKQWKCPKCRRLNILPDYKHSESNIFMYDKCRCGLLYVNRSRFIHQRKKRQWQLTGLLLSFMVVFIYFLFSYSIRS